MSVSTAAWIRRRRSFPFNRTKPVCLKGSSVAGASPMCSRKADKRDSTGDSCALALTPLHRRQHCDRTRTGRRCLPLEERNATAWFVWKNILTRCKFHTFPCIVTFPCDITPTEYHLLQVSPLSTGWIWLWKSLWCLIKASDPLWVNNENTEMEFLCFIFFFSAFYLYLPRQLNKLKRWTKCSQTRE